MRARKALNGRDVLGSDVGAIRIGFARVPVKNGGDTPSGEEGTGVGILGVGDLTLGATIHALRSIKGASTIPADQQVLGGAVENYRSNLLLSLVGSGHQLSVLAAVGEDPNNKSNRTPLVSEQQMIMSELSAGSPEAAEDVASLAGNIIQFVCSYGQSLTINLQISDPQSCITPVYRWFQSALTTADGMRPN